MMDKSDDLLKKIQRAGKEIFGSLDMYTLWYNSRSIMFPPSPASPFIDKFPADNLSGAEQKSAKQQREYEGEVKVYRNLEKLSHRLVVLHNFKYTHQQYKLFVAHDCKRRDREEEGEADFVVVHNNFIAVIEVKTPEFDEKNPKVVFERNYKTSKQQRERTTLLVKGICNKVGTTEPEIRQITVFTNINRKSANKISKYSALSMDEKKSILFEDDLHPVGIGSNGSNAMFQCLGRRNEEGQVEAAVLWTLLGLWCADDKNQFTREKWELGNKINYIDSLIREASISNKPKGPTSSKIKGSPTIFKHLGIKCLTVEQKNVFHDKRRKLMINGPAGSGKTILILGKVMQLAKTSEVRIVIFVANILAAKEFEKHLNTAGIDSQIVIGSRFLQKEFVRPDLKVIIQYFTDKYHIASGKPELGAIEKLHRLHEAFQSDFHIFIDDFHVFSLTCKNANLVMPWIFNDEIRDFWQYVQCQMKESSPRVLWICYDSLQAICDVFDQQMGRINEWTSNTTVHKLSDNLRNSYEIAKFLGFLRFNRLMFTITKMSSVARFTISDPLVGKIGPSIINEYSPFDVTQDIGHYIHGPLPIFRWVDLCGITKEERPLLLKLLIKREIEKLLGCGSVAIIHDDYNPRNIDMDDKVNHGRHLHDATLIPLEEICFQVKEEIDSQFTGYGMNLSVHHFDDAVSAEWPAVVGIIEVNDNRRDSALGYLFNRILKEDKLRENEIISQQLSMDELSARIYAVASRGRTYCTLICVVDFKEPLCSIQYHKDNTAMLYKLMGFDFIDMTLFGGSNPKDRENEYEPLDLTQEQIESFLHDLQSEFIVTLPSNKIVSSRLFAETIARSLGLNLDMTKIAENDSLKIARSLGLNLDMTKIAENDSLKIMSKPLKLTKEDVTKVFRNIGRIKIWISYFMRLMDSFVYREIWCPFIRKRIFELCCEQNIPYPPGEEDLRKLMLQDLSADEKLDPWVTEWALLKQYQRSLFESMSPEKKYAERKVMISRVTPKTK